MWFVCIFWVRTLNLKISAVFTFLHTFLFSSLCEIISLMYTYNYSICQGNYYFNIISLRREAPLWTFMSFTHSLSYSLTSFIFQCKVHIVVVYLVTIVAIGHGLLKKCLPFDNRLRSTHCREFLYKWNYADPLTSLELLSSWNFTTKM